MDKLIITPRTKIYDLLKAYPELEELLIACAPEFRKLKNPVLRKTISRVTSISQAAVIGRLNVEELVNRLREKVGQGHALQLDDKGTTYNTACPEWFNGDAIVHSIDIRDMLNRGEQPLHEVLAAIKNLGQDEILKTIAPFIPAPLLDKSLGLGYKHWLEEEIPGEVIIYFAR